MFTKGVTQYSQDDRDWMQIDAKVRAAEMREATDDCATKIRTQLSADASGLENDVIKGLASTNQLIKILSGVESSEESSISEWKFNFNETLEAATSSLMASIEQFQTNLESEKIVQIKKTIEVTEAWIFEKNANFGKDDLEDSKNKADDNLKQLDNWTNWDNLNEIEKSGRDETIRSNASDCKSKLEGAIQKLRNFINELSIAIEYEKKQGFLVHVSF